MCYVVVVVVCSCNSVQHKPEWINPDSMAHERLGFSDTAASSSFSGKRFMDGATDNLGCVFVLTCKNSDH